MRAGVASLLLLAALPPAGCGKPAPPKVDAATERAQATERAKEGPYGTQVQAHEKAKAMGEDINRKAESRDPDSK
jgi:hypothetical protein